jgi:hypothetical protein
VGAARRFLAGQAAEKFMVNDVAATLRRHNLNPFNTRMAA